MKKLMILTISLFMASALMAANTGIWRSSHTATADTTKNLCGQTSGRAMLHGVCVNDVPGASGTVTLYDSRAAASGAIAVIRSTAAYTSGCQFFDVAVSSGLSYTNSTTNDITILYNCQ
jgi:uncharacterized protein YfiM (DUF2279 family)